MSGVTPPLFGTDGIRARAGEEPLTVGTVRCLGAILGGLLGRSKRVVVGRDTRASGRWLLRALAAGLESRGIRILDAGVIPTPAVAYLTRVRRAAAGIVISASHNPAEFNGIKIFSPRGTKLPDRVEARIERLLYSPNGVLTLSRRAGEGRGEGSSIRGGRGTETAQYAEFLLSTVPGLRLDGLRLVVDCANGAQYKLAPGLLQKLGAEVLPVAVRPDGRNINAGCGAVHVEHLGPTVRRVRADAGIAFDGDADRALFVDARGRAVDGDALLYILARRLLRQGRLVRRTIVATVMSSQGLVRSLAADRVKVLRCPVGDRWVYEAMVKGGANLGGEQSGHIILRHLSPAGDGLLTALHVLSEMREHKASLANLLKGFSQTPQVLENINFPRRGGLLAARPDWRTRPKFAREVTRAEAALGRWGRVFVRHSGTEPLLRILVEGNDMAKVKAAARRLRAVAIHDLA